MLKYSCIENNTKEEEQFLLHCFTEDGRTVLHVAFIEDKTEISEHLMMSNRKLLNVRKKKDTMSFIVPLYQELLNVLRWY